MYRRKIEKRLNEWFDTPKHKPLVVKGVRQCGKTSSVLAFAEKTFKNVVYLDFREHPVSSKVDFHQSGIEKGTRERVRSKVAKFGYHYKFLSSF